MRIVPLVFLPLVTLLWLASGCLEAGRGSVAADGTTSADGQGGDAATDLCEGVVCDDDDPCTTDRCVAETGLCEHLAVPYAGPPASGVCAGDAECDDGDPCTVDSCVVFSDACGPDYSVCEYVPVEGCGGCQLAGCPSDDPCTLGVCQPDGTCAWTTSPGCPGDCSAFGAVTVTNARFGMSPGDYGKIAGRVEGDPTTVCDTFGCACSGLPMATDASGDRLLLHGPVTDDQLPWSCEINLCTTNAWVCAPAHQGASYWLWGTAVTELYSPRSSGAPPERRDDEDDEQGEGDAFREPPPLADGLLVHDFCLQTNAEGLPGRYVGTLESQAPSTTLALEATIALGADGTLALTLREPDCATCGQSEASQHFPQTVPLTAGDGWVRFEIDVPSSCGDGMPPAVATLTSHRNTLAGDYQDAWLAPRRDDGAQIPICTYGTITLTRLP